MNSEGNQPFRVNFEASSRVLVSVESSSTNQPRVYGPEPPPEPETEGGIPSGRVEIMFCFDETNSTENDQQEAQNFVQNFMSQFLAFGEKQKARYVPIEKIKTFLKNFERLPNEEDFGLECVICQENFSQDVKLIETSCSHKFCSKCLEPWLKKNNSCPTCRKPVIKL